MREQTKNVHTGTICHFGCPPYRPLYDAYKDIGFHPRKKMDVTILAENIQQTFESQNWFEPFKNY